MAKIEQIICLADSQKLGGRCIAGRKITGDGFGDWIRPVSAREHGEISNNERKYTDGNFATTLDIISIPTKNHSPHRYQTENYLIDDNSSWGKVGAANWENVESCVDQLDGPLWRNGESTHHGENDKINLFFANELATSLTLIRPEDFVIEVRTENKFNLRTREYDGPPTRLVRTVFKFDNISYDIQLTDVAVKQKYLRKKDGEYSIDEVVLCISLGEPFHGYVYKLVAAVITP